MTSGNDGISFTTQRDLPGSQDDQQQTDMNSNATTATNDGAAADHSITTQGGARQG